MAPTVPSRTGPCRFVLVNAPMGPDMSIPSRLVPSVVPCVEVGSRSVLRNATLTDGRRVDLTIDDAEIGVIADDLPHESGDDDVDLDGYLLLTTAVEPHAHLDKAFLADVVANETGDLTGAIAAMNAARGSIDLIGTIDRAERAARLMAANGFRAVRTHVDVVP